MLLHFRIRANLSAYRVSYVVTTSWVPPGGDRGHKQSHNSFMPWAEYKYMQIRTSVSDVVVVVFYIVNAKLV